MAGKFDEVVLSNSFNKNAENIIIRDITICNNSSFFIVRWITRRKSRM
jgi:hypothetical protein